jgi:hypothetical protein
VKGGHLDTRHEDGHCGAFVYQCFLPAAVKGKVVKCGHVIKLFILTYKTSSTLSDGAPHALGGGWVGAWRRP